MSPSGVHTSLRARVLAGNSREARGRRPLLHKETCRRQNGPSPPASPGRRLLLPDLTPSTETTVSWAAPAGRPGAPLAAAGTPAQRAPGRRPGQRPAPHLRGVGRVSPGTPHSPSPASTASAASAAAAHQPCACAGVAEEKEARRRGRPLEDPPARSSRSSAAGQRRPPTSAPVRGSAALATPAEHFRVRPPPPRGESAFPRPAELRGSLLPPAGHPRNSRLLSRGRAAPSLGKSKRPKERLDYLGSERRGTEAGLVSVPKFGKIPWLSEASFINKPLVLSLPKRYPQNSATFLISSKKDMNLPILFQVPDVLSKARRIQSNPMLIRNKQLCSTCQEIKMVQPKPVIIPHNLKLSFENLMSHRMSLHPPKAQAVLKHSHNDISTESIHYRLPILGPRTAVFNELLADTYATLQETQLSSLPRKEPMGKRVRQ
ncbi:uncharacterized protein C1orf105 homolog [Vulpes vulpes]|uniref:Uncharacterized protein C1orf105 homolog n=1 Tax=Vulpes vulpes TaxID=9627 RepID=A0A3Q7SAH0_VULVU